MSIFLEWTYAQDAYFLAIEGDGTASVIIDREIKTGYISDGGRAGKKGIAGALIDNQDVLSYLIDQGITILVITCSHPHADHMGGLETLVKDPRINNFKVRFVDNDYAQIEGKPSLFDIYKKTSSLSEIDADGLYSTANERNAFESLGLETSEITVSNYVYDSRNIGSSDHDKSVIMQYRLGSGTTSNHIVDFDDASSRLVKNWANESTTKANTVIYPHHGSKNNKIDVLLNDKEKLGFTDVVFTVNKKNRYLHPSPSILKKLLKELGPDHVYATWSELGSNIIIDKDGVRISTGSEIDNLDRLLNLVEVRIEQIQSRIVNRSDSLPIKRKSTISNAIEDPYIQRYQTQLDDLLASRSMILESKRSKFGKASIKRYKTSFESTSKYRKKPPGDAPPPLLPSGNQPTPPTPPGSGGSGRFPELDPSNLSNSDWNINTPHTDKYFTKLRKLSESGPRRSLFNKEIQRPPRWGGVIIGNQTDGVDLKKITFVNLSSDPDNDQTTSSVAIELETSDGNVGRYYQVTASEIWSAYQFVQPMLEFAGSAEKQYLLSNQIGLVGVDEISPNWVWDFAISPSISSTSLAYYGMRLDMFISYAEKHARFYQLPSYARNLDIPYEKISTYQWHDAKSEVFVDNGLVSVEPSSGPQSCLMRVRVVPEISEDQKNIFKAKLKKSLSFEKAALINSFLSREVREAYSFEIASPFPPVEIDDIIDLTGWNGEQSARIATSRVDIALIGSPPGTSFRLRQLVRATQNRINEWYIEKYKSKPGLTKNIPDLCRSYEPLYRIDRFSKIIAILNHFKKTSGEDLPNLPDFIVPTIVDVPLQLGPRDVIDENDLGLIVFFPALVFFSALFLLYLVTAWVHRKREKF